MLSLLSRLASAAAFLWAKGSITYRQPWLKNWGAAARIAMSRVPRRLLRDGVDESRLFVMLPSFGLSLLDWLSRDSSALVSRRVAVGAVSGVECPEESPRAIELASHGY